MKNKNKKILLYCGIVFLTLDAMKGFPIIKFVRNQIIFSEWYTRTFRSNNKGVGSPTDIP